MIKKNPILDIKKIKGIVPTNLGLNEFEQLYINEFTVVIHEITNNEKITKQLKNYLVIRLVTVLETFFRNKTIKIIDENNFEISGLFNKGELTIALSDFEEIQKTEFTKGRIVATNFNFQNINEINFVYSKLLGVDFLETVKQATTLKELLDNGTEVTRDLLPSLYSNWTELLGIFQIRNEIIHNIRSVNDIEKDSEHVVRFFNHCLAFLSMCELIITWCVHVKSGHSMESKKQEYMFRFIHERMKDYKNNLKIKNTTS